MAVTTIHIDVDAIYRAWRTYLLANSPAKYFGMLYDPSKQSKFPYANFRMISRPKNGGDLEGDEATVSLTFETEALINTDKYLTLYDIDQASADFFASLGFSRVGDSQPIRVSDTVTKIQSRFYMRNYGGAFLIDISNNTSS